MGRITYFGVYIDKEILNKFLKEIYKNYYRGKIRKVIENMMVEYVNKKSVK